MFRFARHEGGTAVPVRCTGVPLGERRVRRTVLPPTKRGAKPRYFRFADSRFSVAKTSQDVCGFLCQRCSSLGRQCHACAQKKPPTEVGGAVLTSKLPLIWLAALAWTALLATLPGLLLLLTRLLLAAAALLAARATLTALTAALVLLATLILLARLLFVGVHISAPSVPSVT
jgi:hypothetical protein